jgi:hypothetical protein
MRARTSSILAAAVATSLVGTAMARPPQDPWTNAGIMSGSGVPTENGTVLYDNVPVPPQTVFTTTSVPRTGGADEALFDGPGATLTSMEFGFSIATGGPAAFDARIRLWDDLEPTGSTVAGVPQFANLKHDVTLQFTGQTPGAFISTPVALPNVLVTANPATLGVPNLTDVYYQVDFYNAGTQTHVTGNAVTFIFDGSGVNVGRTFSDPLVGGDGTAATELYWRDVNDNQTIAVDEARNFAAPNRANMVLRFNGKIIPEPGTLSLAGIGLGVLGLRRRRSA